MSTVGVVVRPVREDELEACAQALRRAFATVAREFGLTRENCVANAAFCTAGRLLRERGRGRLQFGAFPADGGPGPGLPADGVPGLALPADGVPGPTLPAGSVPDPTLPAEAVAGPTPVGFFALRPGGRETWELEKVAVVPEARHEGVGRILLDAAVEQVRAGGGRAVTIGIIEDNTRLKDWYAAYGFVHTGTVTYPHLPFVVGEMELPLAPRTPEAE